jgi:hypothetical protein
MCSQTTCRTCHRPTWAGCGAHVEQALSDIPWELRCKCRDAGRKPATPRPASASADQASLPTMPRALS